MAEFRTVLKASFQNSGGELWSTMGAPRDVNRAVRHMLEEYEDLMQDGDKIIFTEVEMEIV